MKISRTSLALAAVAGALAFNPTMFAQDTKAPATGNPPAERRGPGGPGGERRGMPSVENQLTQLTEKLKLTEEQKPKVKAVLEEQFKAMQGLRELPQEERQPKMRAAREEMNKKMKEILTADQFKQYEESMAAMRQQRQQNRGPGGPATGNAEKPADKPADQPAEKKDVK